jgi:putative inorganic carbon (HCO3(-)) transporter
MNIDINLKIFSFTRRITISRESIQYGVIALVIVVSIAVAYWGSVMILMLLLAALGGIAVLITIRRYPDLGFILILLGGMFVPFSGPGGINASILAVILLVGLWIMDMLVVKRRFQFIRSRAIYPVFYFILVSIIAFVMGQIPWFVFANQAPLDAQIGGFAIYFFLLATMIMTANLIKDVRWLQVIVWVFVGLGALYVFGRTLHLSFADRIYQNGFYANSMFWMWLVALPLSQAVFNTRLKLRVRLLLYGIVALTFYVALVQQNDWKSGWVPAAVVAAALFGLRFKRLTLLSIPFMLLVTVYLAQDLISTDLYSWGTRLDAWVIVLEISRVSPVIGLGFANYYWYAPLFPIRGYYIRFNSHSQFVDIVAQTGLLGLFCFFWLLFEVGRLAWNLINKLPDGFAKGYAYGIFAGVLGSIMAAFLVDWLLPFAYNIGLDGVRASILPWIFFGGLVSIEQIYFANQQTGAANTSELSQQVKH